MEWAETLTAGNGRMTLFIAFNYGGRREIVDAVRRAAADGLDIATLTEDDIVRHLYSPLMRDPDLCIRTSGERRMSNFLLWQSAYSELYFSDRLWPDFDEEEFERALADYVEPRTPFRRSQRGRGCLDNASLVAVIGLPIGLAAIILGGYFLFGLAIVVSLLGLHEYYTLLRPYRPNLLVGYLSGLGVLAGSLLLGSRRDAGWLSRRCWCSPSSGRCSASWARTWWAGWP